MPRPWFILDFVRLMGLPALFITDRCLLFNRSVGFIVDDWNSIINTDIERWFCDIHIFVLRNNLLLHKPILFIPKLNFRRYGNRLTVERVPLEFTRRVLVKHLFLDRSMLKILFFQCKKINENKFAGYFKTRNSYEEIRLGRWSTTILVQRARKITRSTCEKNYTFHTDGPCQVSPHICNKYCVISILR